MENKGLKRFLIVIAVTCGLGISFTHARAARTSASDFHPLYRIQDTTLTLSGVGQLRYLGFIRIYDGALYLPRSTSKDNALADVPKRLEVRYLRSFKAEDFGPATIAGMKKNVDDDTYARLEPKIEFHNSLYEDIAPGDRVSLTYLPSVGTQVAINGKAKGTIEGAEFAAALFSLWLGEKPFDAKFKRDLLGGQ